VAILAPGFDPLKAARTALLTRIMFPFILLVSLAALVMGMLNAKSVSSAGQPWRRAFSILGSIIGGVTLGWMIDPRFRPPCVDRARDRHTDRRRVAARGAAAAIGRLGLPLSSRIFSGATEGVIAILALMGPAVIAASTTQFNVLINSMFASTLGDGAIFWLAIAFRLMQLPLGLFGVALGTVTLPLLSRFVVANQMTAFRIRARARLAAHVPADHSIDHRTHHVWPNPIISVLYQHGKFDAYQTMPRPAGPCASTPSGSRATRRSRYWSMLSMRSTDARHPMIVSFLAVGPQSMVFNWLFTFHLGWGRPWVRLLDRVRGDLQFLAACTP
jgi:putative peptidoglycan lipid II flippase